MQSIGRVTRISVLLAVTASGATGQTLHEDGSEREIRPWAGPDLVRNPVAITMDPWGNVYIAESDRAGEAVTDTRQLGHLDAVKEDLLLQTVEDRRTLIQKWIDQGAFESDYFTRTEDRVRLVRDTDSDGIADTASVFAGGFNDALDGIGSGVLWRDGSVYFTCIPHLWRLTDEDGDGADATRESLSYGYGVRWCFYGHDMHGLVNGPDGRIYFSMGDRGFNVETPEGERFVGPDRGGVFRCWPDGSGLELYYVGLRNPQELAFDEFGNLFTGDNNCDSGDRARVVYVIEGGDSGWRQDVQSLPSRGPWNREQMWELMADALDPARPAWALPPIDHVGAGPSGIAYYPGTGESNTYDDTILMVDFYGSGSTVHSFRASPVGAGFRLTDKHEFYKGTTVTDIAWGPDSRLYLSDWGEGWGPNPKGNIFTITNETVHAEASAEIADVRSILESGFDALDANELTNMLGHRDQRVRQGAQYALAARGAANAELLSAVAHDTSATLLQRVHSIWCLGQIARSAPGAAGVLADLVDDADEQIRMQTVRTLGDLATGSPDAYVAALRDESEAVTSAAAIALGKLDHGAAVPEILDALDRNADRDVFLRHSLAYALELIDEPDATIDACAERGRSARLGAVIALRRLEHPGVSAFLADPDAGVAIEAARAVYDHYLDNGMPALARRLGRGLSPELLCEPFVRRAIEANVLIGGSEQADRLARFASLSDVPSEWRKLALERLTVWADPLEREGVWGNWVDLPARPASEARRAVLSNLVGIRSASAGDDELLALADTLEARYGLEFDMDRFLADLLEGSRGENSRLVRLDQIAEHAPESLAEACERVLAAPTADTTARLRMRARELLAESGAEGGLEALIEAAESGSVRERQHAVTTLASVADPLAASVLADLASRLMSGELEPAVALEIFEAGSLAPTGSPVREAAESIRQTQPDLPAGFQTLLLARGGSVERGRDLFVTHDSAQCYRCHRVGGDRVTAGPDLEHVGSRLSRAALVQSIIEPAASIAQGFGPVSAMPATAVHVMQPREIRDIVAYLATLQDPSVGPAPEQSVAELEAATDAEAPVRADTTETRVTGFGVALIVGIVVGVVAVPVILAAGFGILTRLDRKNA